MAKLTNRTFGIELEVIFPKETMDKIYEELKSQFKGSEKIKLIRLFLSQNGFNNWEAGFDNSIIPNNPLDFGVEIKSKILQGNSGLQEIVKMCKFLKQHAYTNDSTGTHVHLDAADFLKDKKEAKVLYALLQFKKNEKEFEKILLPSRVSNPFARSIGETEELISQFRTFFNKEQSVMQLMNTLSQTRHSSLNIHSLLDHGTLEFRQLHGTLNEKLIVNWITIAGYFLDKVSETFQSVASSFESPEKQFTQAELKDQTDTIRFIIANILKKNGELKQNLSVAEIANRIQVNISFTVDVIIPLSLYIFAPLSNQDFQMTNKKIFGPYKTMVELFPQRIENNSLTYSFNKQKIAQLLDTEPAKKISAAIEANKISLPQRNVQAAARQTKVSPLREGIK